jgi:TetR/AcrR family transcriptional regulator
MTRESHLPARAPAVKRQARRQNLESAILAVAQERFALQGYGGVSVDEIAADAGISKQSLLYYFPSKKALYRRVFNDVLDSWLSNLNSLADANLDPHAALERYVTQKLRFSFDQPSGSRLFAQEIIAQAPLCADDIEAKLVPAFRAEAAVLQRWMADGDVAPLPVPHLLFTLWAMTQTYADFAWQMRILLGKRALGPADFDQARETIVRMLEGALGLSPPAASGVLR